jgi:hypothetical protein
MDFGRPGHDHVGMTDRSRQLRESLKPDPLGISDAVARLETFNIDNLLRTTEVMTSVADIERRSVPLGRVFGLDRPSLTESLIGLSNERRTVLSSAYGATATVSALRQTLERQTSVSGTLIGQLATVAGINARIDLSQSLAASVGVKTGEFYRLPEVLRGDPSGLSETMRSLSAVSLFGEAGKRRFDRWIVGFKPHLEHLFGFVERLAAEREELAEGSVVFVERHGWPLPLALPPSSLHRILALVDRPKREVRRAMVKAFAPRTQAFLYSRDTLLDSEPFRSRKRPIEQAVRALRREDHYAAICTMLPLIEGVLVDVAFSGQATRGSNIKKALEKLAPPGSVEEDWALRMIETMLLSGAGGVALFSHFERRDYGVPGESRRLNRHAILHGSARRYGTTENSLKLFLLLVALADALDSP